MSHAIHWRSVAAFAAVATACSSQSPATDLASDDASTDAAAPNLDATNGSDSADDAAAPASDATIPPRDGAPLDDGASGGCGDYAGDAVYTCSKDGTSRGKCVDDASVSVEVCPRGCLRAAPGKDAVCMGTTTTLDCTGSYGKTKAADGDYYITAFGCWIDANGGEHTDPGDNCLPSCFAQAKAAGLCDANGTGKACEEKITWYTADAARFGCLAHLKVTDPKSGKSVIALALDYGPACSVENGVSRAVLDTSGRIDRYLFGADQGSSDKTLVHVVEVDASYPLGPVP